MIGKLSRKVQAIIVMMRDFLVRRAVRIATLSFGDIGLYQLGHICLK